MRCKICGTENQEGMRFCKECGAPLSGSTDTAKHTDNNAIPIPPESGAQRNRQENYNNYQNNQQGYSNGQQFTPQYAGNNQSAVSDDYKPISMWGYFGYQLLFAIPLVGFILILVFSFGGTRNINLKNFARSRFCALILGIVIGIIVIMYLGAVGARYYW